jgi:hypothetical protein
MNGAEIMADVSNFTNGQLQIQIGNIVFGAKCDQHLACP